MKEKWSIFKESLSDVTTMTKREFLLTLAVCVLGGIVFGVFLSPKKSMVIGSNNGNNSGNCGQKKSSEDEEKIADWNEAEAENEP